MFRKRLVAVCFLAAFAAQTTLTGVASAQDVIDLDAEAPPPKKGGKAPSGKKGVDIDLDEGAPAKAGELVQAVKAL